MLLRKKQQRKMLTVITPGCRRPDTGSHAARLAERQRRVQQVATYSELRTHYGWQSAPRLQESSLPVYHFVSGVQWNTPRVHDMPLFGNTAPRMLNNGSPQHQGDNNKPHKKDDYVSFELEGFAGVFRPGIWDINTGQYGVFDKMADMEIADQIRLKAQMNMDNDSFSSGSYSTEVDTISYQESCCFNDDLSEDVQKTEESRRPENRFMRFLRRVKKALF